MKVRVDEMQVEKLILELKKHNLPIEMIYSMFNINTLFSLSIVQYNYLLLIINS